MRQKPINLFELWNHCFEKKFVCILVLFDGELSNFCHRIIRIRCYKNVSGLKKPTKVKNVKNQIFRMSCQLGASSKFRIWTYFYQWNIFVIYDESARMIRHDKSQINQHPIKPESTITSMLGMTLIKVNISNKKTNVQQ